MTSRLLFVALATLSIASGCADPVELALRRAGASEDVGAPRDARPEPIDAGERPEPRPCLRDQGGPENRGCSPGQVCHLPSGECRPGRPCRDDGDCDGCSDATTEVDCGHGFRLTTWCDGRHGSVCVRSRASCEPCDDNCGRLNGELGHEPIACLAYDDGQRYCGRKCNFNCPDGFECIDDHCRRPLGCNRNSVICPTHEDPSSECSWTGQICEGDMCPGIDATCVTNDLPGVLGLCLGSCTRDADCPEARPLCNPRNGICTLACGKGNCSPDQTCHHDGLCWPACRDDGDCVSRDDDTYCNLPGRGWPRAYKPYRDANSCAPIGCEGPDDCPTPRTFCDRSSRPPQCASGCLEDADCRSGEACKARPPGSEDPRSCGHWPDYAGQSGSGVCCALGCSDRTLQCAVNEFCCGEPDSPYEDGACPSVDGSPAAAGSCFDAPVDPFCQPCILGTGGCEAAWSFGQNVDPTIEGGRPFDEQSFCFAVGGGRGICSVGYNPRKTDPGAPRGWICEAYTIPCFDDADCGGLTCVGAQGDDRAGVCRCAREGTSVDSCPARPPRLSEVVTRPRCHELESPPFGALTGDRFCVAAYVCRPPRADPGIYPPACGL